MNKKILIVNDLKRNDRYLKMNTASIVSSFGDRPYFEISDNIVYDAFITGYIEDPNSILDIRERIADSKLDNQRTLAFVDPVIGDNGSRYSFITDSHINNYKKLIKISDIMAPNLTEACILSGESYDKYREKYCTINYDNSNESKIDDLSKKIIESIFPLMDKIRYKKNQITIIKGIELYNAVLTILDVFDGDHGKRQTTCNYSNKIEDRYGAGEIFSGMFFETSTNGFNLVDALSISTSFINNSLRFSSDNKFDTKDGIVFEPILHDNIQVIKKRLQENKAKNNTENNNKV